MNLVHRVTFALQIVLAELIFLAPAGKRRYFSLRYPAAALFSIAASCLFVFYVDWIPYALARLLRMVLVFSAHSGGYVFLLRAEALDSVCRLRIRVRAAAHFLSYHQTHWHADAVFSPGKKSWVSRDGSGSSICCSRYFTCCLP